MKCDTKAGVKEREIERGRETDINCCLLYLNSNCENRLCLNNACDAQDFTLTRRYLIELMGKMPSLSPGVNMQRRGRRGVAGQQKGRLVI